MIATPTPRGDRVSPRVVGIATAAFLVLATLLALASRRPPASLPVDAPADRFSAERAMVHVTAIAARPHPIGSADHARVRDYLARALTDLGLEVDIQRTTGVTAKYGVAGAVENVVGRLRGGASTGAVMLAAHYDSVAAGPGAGDDASGVAAILEALRARKQAPKLRNDLLVLFSDGEETGLLGASAFMAEHPWAASVKVAVNFEARGDSGVSSLFETSEENGFLVAEAARGVPRLVGSSLAYEVYRRMPNDTDATVFKAHGLAALNFAFVGRWGAYHTPNDDAAHLDHGSLQQQGEYALGLAYTLGNDDLTTAHAPDAVYFSLPAGFFIHYSHASGVAFATLACLLLAFAVNRRVRATATSLGVLGGVAFFVVSLAVTGGVGFAFATIVGVANGGILPGGERAPLGDLRVGRSRPRARRLLRRVCARAQEARDRRSRARVGGGDPRVRVRHRDRGAWGGVPLPLAWGPRGGGGRGES